LGTTAVIALVFVAISLLSTIEATVNDIWGVPRGRSWLARIEKYWAVITFGPIFLLVAMGLNLGPYFEKTSKFLKFAPFLGTIIFSLLPLVILILVLTLFYLLMPNTKVNWRAAMVGGSVAGILWHLNNVFNVVYFGRVVRESQIYGKLAILPVFLIGLYFSWLILLFGAQVAYAFQNRRTYLEELRAENVNERGREFIALRLMTYVAQQFHRGDRPPTSTEIAGTLGVPGQLVSKVMQPLLQANLVFEVASTTSDETAYAPAHPLDQISCQDILDSMRSEQGIELPTREEPSRELVRSKFDEIATAEQKVGGAITLQSLVEEEEEMQRLNVTHLQDLKA
jgi:membrane protein